MIIMIVRMVPSAREAGEEACGKVSVLRAPLGARTTRASRPAASGECDKYARRTACVGAR